MQAEKDSLGLKIHLPAATLNSNGGSQKILTWLTSTHIAMGITSTKLTCLSQISTGNQRPLGQDQPPQIAMHCEKRATVLRSWKY